MKITLSIVIALILALFLSGYASAKPTENDGKKAFIEKTTRDNIKVLSFQKTDGKISDNDTRYEMYYTANTIDKYKTKQLVTGVITFEKRESGWVVADMTASFQDIGANGKPLSYQEKLQKDHEESNKAFAAKAESWKNYKNPKNDEDTSTDEYVQSATSTKSEIVEKPNSPIIEIAAPSDGSIQVIVQNIIEEKTGTMDKDGTLYKIYCLPTKKYKNIPENLNDKIKFIKKNASGIEINKYPIIYYQARENHYEPQTWLVIATKTYNSVESEPSLIHSIDIK